MLMRRRAGRAAQPLGDYGFARLNSDRIARASCTSRKRRLARVHLPALPADVGSGHTAIQRRCILRFDWPRIPSLRAASDA
jgi:hypothetical protein